VTDEEFINYFKTAGIIAKDPVTLQPKIKIYRDENGVPKGDGLVTFLKVLAIPTAFQILDGFDFRPPENCIVKLELAKFENKPGKEKPRPSAPFSKKQKRYNQETAELGWEEKEQKHVIIKHMFDANVAAQDVNFYDKLKEEIEIEFNRIGPIEALKIFERNPEGVVAVKYQYELDAQKCIERMNGRWFDARQLIASYYDGYTDYFVRESEDQQDQRDKNWEKWLLGNDEYEKNETSEKGANPEVKDEGDQHLPEEKASVDEKNQRT